MHTVRFLRFRLGGRSIGPLKRECYEYSSLRRASARPSAYILLMEDRDVRVFANRLSSGRLVTISLNGSTLPLRRSRFRGVMSTPLAHLLIDGLGDSESTSSHLTDCMITLQLRSLLDAGVLALIGPPLRRAASSFSLIVSL
jgi:hypothetical protein